MKRGERLYPPNCTVCDQNPSRFLAFRQKRREVEAEYGFRLGVRRRTPEEREGYRRYMRDWRRRYRAEHLDEIKAYRHNYWKNVTKRGFDSKAASDGDAEEMKRIAERKAKRRKRAKLEARKQEIHAKYGFWLGKKPRTPEEVAGRERYRKEWGAAYRATHKKQEKEYRKLRAKREKERKERKFQEKYHALLAVDPVKAESMRRKHETLCLIQNMTHEERVRYRQQKQFDRLKARAEREAAREAQRQKREAERKKQKALRKEREALLKKRREERKRLKREKSAAAYKAKRKAEKHNRREAWLAMCAEMRANAATVEETARQAEAAFAAERERNRVAYLAAKEAMRERNRPLRGFATRGEANTPSEARAEGTGNGERDAGGSQSSATTEQPTVASIKPVPTPLPILNIADYLPHHPFRGILLEDTAPTDEELAGEVTSPVWADYAADEIGNSAPAAGGGSTPIDPPTGNGTTTGGSEDDDDDWRRREREEKIRRIQEQYGFTLGKKPVTPEEIEGKKRYTADRARETAIRNREIDFMLHGKERVRKAAAKKRKATIARKKREAAAQAAREAKAAEREALRKEREAARQAAREAKLAALEAERKERAEFKAMARELHIPLQKARWTPQHQAIWNRAVRRKEKAVIEAGRDERRKERRARQTAEAGVKAERAKALEEKRRVIREKYGFTLGKRPETPEEIEGKKRWLRDKEAEERKRRHDKITEYNREYRRRRRAEALAEAQTKWTPKQWEEWQKRQDSKDRGSPAWLIKEVAKFLAEDGKLPVDDVMAWLIEHDGIDFLVKGAESMGKSRCQSRAVIHAAARAVALYIDPDNAVMFADRATGNGKPGTES